MQKETTSERIVRRIRERIEQGTYTPGQPLPLRKEMAQEFHISPDTLNKALRALEMDGSIRRGRGRALVVAEKRERVTTNDETFRGYMEGKGYRVVVEPLASPGIIAAPPVLARAFRIPAHSPVVERARREIVNGTPYRYSRKYYRVDLIDTATLEAIRRDQGYNVRAVLEKIVPLMRIQERLFARSVTSKEEADILQVSLGTPVMEVWKINMGSDQQVLYISTVVFVGKYFEKVYDYAPGDEPRASGHFALE